MEKFSNKREDYWNQIIKDLSVKDDSGDFRFRYLEVGQLLSHGFSVLLSRNNPIELHVKIWNAEYDQKRFDKGIFNLDRLAITNSIVPLNIQESKTINRLLESELKQTEWNGIVLDGLFCQFEIDKRKLNWNSNEEMGQNLTKLVDLLRNKVNEYHNFTNKLD